MSTSKAEPQREKGARGLFGLPPLARRTQSRKQKGESSFAQTSASHQIACIGGSLALSKTFLAPLERVKILMQVSHMANVP